MSSTPQQIEAEIINQRAQLADTVDALGAKLDVKARAGAKASDVKDRATTSSGKPRPELIGGVVAVLLAAGALVWWRQHG